MAEQNPILEPVDDEVVQQITNSLQAEGPDEYPEGYYRHLAESLYRAGVRVREQAIGQVETDARVLLADKIEKIAEAQRKMIVRSDEIENVEGDLVEYASLRGAAEGLGIALTILQTD